MYNTGDLFPFNDVRPVQKEMMDSVREALQKESNLISHAPTGLGKTVASLAPALEYALDNNKVIFFLTSRHTQHKIAIETMKEIKKAKGIQFNVVDFIGKKSMCMVPGVQSLSSSEFLEYCRTVSRKDYTCEFYTNTRKQGLQATMKAQEAVTRAKNMDLDNLLEFCSKERLCPYEISMMLAEKARVVVCDYNYIFNDSIRNMILGKMDRVLSDCIVIIDEGHNLPFRIRDLMTSRITKNVLEKASKEAKKFQYMDISEEIDSIANSLITLAGGLNEGDEKKV
ncbi:MAG: DEAD/DEAH box helicase family protein, partial [Candidatus Woesearchaeota archaeon]